MDFPSALSNPTLLASKKEAKQVGVTERNDIEYTQIHRHRHT